MLNFSNSKVLTIYITFILVSIFSLTNFLNFENPFLKKKINLGLDLQGGSYLLLEVDSSALEKRRLQSKVILIKKTLNDYNIKNTDCIFFDDTPKNINTCSDKGINSILVKKGIGIDKDKLFLNFENIDSIIRKINDLSRNTEVDVFSALSFSLSSLNSFKKTLGQNLVVKGVFYLADKQYREKLIAIEKIQLFE